MLDEDSRKADSDNDDASSAASVPFTLPKPVVQIDGFKPTPMQGSFQSGSTPTHLSSRYMVSTFNVFKLSLQTVLNLLSFFIVYNDIMVL